MNTTTITVTEQEAEYLMGLLRESKYEYERQNTMNLEPWWMPANRTMRTKLQSAIFGKGN